MPEKPPSPSNYPSPPLSAISRKPALLLGSQGACRDFLWKGPDIPGRLRHALVGSLALGRRSGARPPLQKWPLNASSLAVGWPKLAHCAGVILVGENKGSAQNRSRFWTCALPCDFCLD